MAFDLNDIHSKPSRTWLHSIADGFRHRPRAVWTVSAVLSVLSSRHILVEYNLHFPLHLHLVQLAATGLLIATDHWRQDVEIPRCSSEQLTRSGWAVLLMLSVLLATAAIFSIQAVLHFQNLSTLVMLGTVSCCIEAWLLLGTALVPRSRIEFVRAIVLTLGCVGILLFEYRLEVAALVTAILAALLTGLARALQAAATDFLPRGIYDGRWMCTVFCCAGFAITGICSTVRADESWAEFFKAMRPGYSPLLVLNAFTTAVATLSGQSILLPLSCSRHRFDDSKEDAAVKDALALLAMAGAIGLASTLKLRRSYMSFWQFFHFFIAIATCTKATSTFSHRQSGIGQYEVAPDSFAIPSMNGRDRTVSEASDAAAGIGTNSDRKSVLPSSALIALILPSLWLSYTIFNFSDRTYQDPFDTYPALDLDYTPAIPLEVVISMYKEPVIEVARLISKLKAMPNLREAQFHLYVKDKKASTEWVKQGTGANQVSTLPNVGREGETYLYHILHNWNSLANRTIFLQADVHNPREFYPRIRDYFDPVRTGMLNLGWSGQVCNCEECGDRFGFRDTTHLFPRIQNRIDNSTQCGHVLLSYKGQFVASAKRIRGVDKSVYHDLREAFVNKDSWAHQKEFFQDMPDSMSAPVFGYTMERMWNLLFQCNSMEVAWKCPTLISGNRIGGTIEDCQCFDPVS